MRGPTPPEWRAGLEPCAVCGSTENLEGHHVIEKRVLKVLGFGDRIWDRANRLSLCERHHSRHTTRLEPIARELIPAAAWEFADELGLRWLIEKRYPSREAVVA